MACATDFYRCSCGAVVKCRTTCTQCLPAKRAAAEARAVAEFNARKEQAEMEQRALEERKRAEARAVAQTFGGRPAVPDYSRTLEPDAIDRRMVAAFKVATDPMATDGGRDNALRCYCIALRERLEAEGMSALRQDSVIHQHIGLIGRQLSANRVSKSLNDAREQRGQPRLDELADKALNEYEKLFPERADRSAWAELERAQQANEQLQQQAMAQNALAMQDQRQVYDALGMRMVRSGQNSQGRLFTQQGFDEFYRKNSSG